MIKKLDSIYRDSLFKFLKKDAELNLFIIGDIEQFGFDTDFQDVWAEFDDQDQYIAVLLRFKTHFVFYSSSPLYDIKSFSKIINSFPEKTDISGELSIIEGLSESLQFCKRRDQYFARLISGDRLLEDIKKYSIYKAAPEDAEDLFSLRGKITEFEDFKTTLDNVRESLQGSSGKTFCIREHGELIASAATTAENSASAMVISVMTHPDHRKKGLASACVSKLCKELLCEGKTLCLFYDNPKAGSVYKKLGFEDIGRWSTLLF